MKGTWEVKEDSEHNSYLMLQTRTIKWNLQSLLQSSESFFLQIKHVWSKKNDESGPRKLQGKYMKVIAMEFR